jgi:Asp-tRNA(Asn)/Glu-tRNA(Gln) amidotransferase C subunit
MEDKSILERMLKTAKERYGPEEAERLKPFIERISEAVRKVQEFELEPGDEPSGDPREDR